MTNLEKRLSKIEKDLAQAQRLPVVENYVDLSYREQQGQIEGKDFELSHILRVLKQTKLEVLKAPIPEWHKHEMYAR